jgi:hypothetical protein
VVVEVATPNVHPEVGPVAEDPSIGSYPVFTSEVTASRAGIASGRVGAACARGGDRGGHRGGQPVGNPGGGVNPLFAAPWSYSVRVCARTSSPLTSGRRGPLVGDKGASWGEHGASGDGAPSWFPIEATYPPLPRTTFGDGPFAVGEHIAPGTYTATTGETCYWERLSGFAGALEEIIDNNDPGEVTVTIEPSDVGFLSLDCGPWNPASP